MLKRIVSVVIIIILGLSLVMVINLAIVDMSYSETELVYNQAVDGDIVDNSPNLSWYVDSGNGTDINCSSDYLYCAVTYKVSPYLEVYKYDGNSYNLVDSINFSTYPNASLLSLDFNSDASLLAVSYDVNSKVEFYERVEDSWDLVRTVTSYSGSSSLELYDIAFSDDDKYFMFGSLFNANNTGTFFGVYKYVDDSVYYNTLVIKAGQHPTPYVTKSLKKFDFIQDGDDITVVGVALNDVFSINLNTLTDAYTYLLDVTVDTGLSQSLVASAMSHNGEFIMTQSSNLTFEYTNIYDFNPTTRTFTDRVSLVNIGALGSESDLFGVEFLGDYILYVLGDVGNKIVYNSSTDNWDVVTNDITGYDGESHELFYNYMSDEFWLVDEVGLKVYNSNSITDEFSFDFLQENDSIVGISQDGVDLEFTQVGDNITVINPMVAYDLEITYMSSISNENLLYSLFPIFGVVFTIISIVVYIKMDV